MQNHSFLGKTVLITGGCGFIGSHFVEACHVLGMTVYVLDNLSSGKNVFKTTSDCSSSLVYTIGDIRDKAIFSRLPQKIDFVIHLAAAVSVAESVTNPQKYMLTNVEGSRNVFQYAVDAKASAVLSASTAAYYGDCGKSAITEAFPYGGISPYAESKMEMERLGAEFQKTSRCRFIFCRFFNVYGPRQDPSSPYTGVMSIFMDRCAARKPITIFGTGEQTRDFVFIKDLIVAAINLLGQLDKFPIGADAVQQNDPEEVQRSAYTGEGVYPTVFNIGSGISISVNELAELAKIVSGRHEVEIVHGEPRSGDILHSLSDCTRIRNATGWSASTTLRVGMSETWGWAAGEISYLSGDLVRVLENELKIDGVPVAKSLCGKDVDVKEIGL